MLKIYKYPFETTDAYPKINIPSSCRILKIAFDAKINKACVWAEVNTDTNVIAFEMASIATGDEVPENVQQHFAYFDTVIKNSGTVWHIYLPRTYLQFLSLIKP